MFGIVRGGSLASTIRSGRRGTITTQTLHTRLFENYPEFEDQIEHVHHQPEQSARTRPAEPVLPQELAGRLWFDLYTHQAEALDHLQRGEDVCVSTSTSSGKTWIYALQIARQHLRDPDSTALLVYPTKALSGDQKKELDSFYSRLGLDLHVGVYDGDATAAEKRSIRRGADVVITNFAGLNQYLPHHEKWDRLFSNMATVVVEEAHAYNGVLGMHVAWILRRLFRILEHPTHGADPRMILTSATIGNPADHARRLTGREVTVVENDGSPRGEREIVLWNPPKYDEDAELRQSTHRESSHLLAHFIDRGLQTLMFAPSRKMTELDRRWTLQRLRESYGRSAARVDSYNAAHRKEERRRAEKALKQGDLEGVVTTTALEMGINIGHVDAVILSGYPGSRQSFWQQIGRAGRERRRSVNVLVAHPSALDQYIMRHPQYLLEQDVEDAVVDLNNNTVYLQHVEIAARELPLTREDTVYFGDRLPRAVDLLRRKNVFSGELDGKVYFVDSRCPEREVNLYGTGDHLYEVRLKEDGDTRTLDRKINRTRAYRDFHPGAIYLHKGGQFRVETHERDAEQPWVELKRVDVDYYTDSVRKPEIKEVEAEQSRSIGEFTLRRGRGKVDEYYPYYRRKSLENQAILETSSTGLDDPVTLRTQLLWLECPESLVGDVRERFDPPQVDSRGSSNDPFLGSIHAIEHGLVHMAPAELLIHRDDLGGISMNDHPATGQPAIFLYDSVEGGLGFTREMYRTFDRLVERTAELIDSCPCRTIRGCPACVMDYRCGSNNEPLQTAGAVWLLNRIAQA